MTNFSPKYESCMGRGVFHGYDNKISLSSEIFAINRTKLKNKKSLIFETSNQ